MTLSRRRSLSRHTLCEIAPRFLRSHLDFLEIIQIIITFSSFFLSLSVRKKGLTHAFSLSLLNVVRGITLSKIVSCWFYTHGPYHSPEQLFPGNKQVWVKLGAFFSLRHHLGTSTLLNYFRGNIIHITTCNRNKLFNYHLPLYRYMMLCLNRFESLPP